MNAGRGNGIGYCRFNRKLRRNEQAQQVGRLDTARIDRAGEHHVAVEHRVGGRYGVANPLMPGDTQSDQIAVIAGDVGDNRHQRRVLSSFQHRSWSVEHFLTDVPAVSQHVA